MKDPERIPHSFDQGNLTCKAIIETPKGRRNKFKFEPKFGLFELSHVLPEGFSFPFDFGFIPSTMADDGDAIDVLVLMDEPAHVGCLLEVRLLGVIETEQVEDGKRSRNDRLIAASTRSFEYRDAQSIADLRKSLVDQITEFIALYNKNAGKRDEVKGVAGPERAVKLLEDAMAKFAQEEQKN
jgi:inorganic pyrophosphatase